MRTVARVSAVVVVAGRVAAVGSVAAGWAKEVAAKVAAGSVSERAAASRADLGYAGPEAAETRVAVATATATASLGMTTGSKVGGLRAAAAAAAAAAVDSASASAAAGSAAAAGPATAEPAAAGSAARDILRFRLPTPAARLYPQRTVGAARHAYAREGGGVTN